MMILPSRIKGALALGAAFALPFLALAPVIPAQAQNAQDDLAAVDRTIRSIKSLSADFAQTDRNGQTATGKLLWKQPGKIRFDYGKGGDMLIVADGKSLYVIDYQVAQVQRWPIRNTPLGPLLDPTRDLSKYGKVVDSGDPRVVSVEVRDAGHPEYGVLSLVFMRKAAGSADLDLYGWVAKDAQGNRTTVRFTNMKLDAPIADSAFKWRDPRPNQIGPRR